jgi:hypothetical protein
MASLTRIVQRGSLSAGANLQIFWVKAGLLCVHAVTLNYDVYGGVDEECGYC